MSFIVYRFDFGTAAVAWAAGPAAMLQDGQTPVTVTDASSSADGR
ncbi:hypothetical protein [Devosia psychrophila]|nr:hypothetical protein [Devosia psychrophila]